MRIDKTFDTYNPATFVEEVRSLEDAGYDGLVIGEAANDPTVALAVAAEHTSRVELVAGVLVALPRSPMHVAYAANDLQSYSQGRYVLGLGSQIKAHVERRFSARWESPAVQMREYVQSIRAIFDAWETGDKLDFHGDHYAFTLMPDYFRPLPSGFGCPPIWMAGVGPLMCRTAAEVADGLFVHPFTTESYLRGPLSAWLEEGQKRSGRIDRTSLALPILVGVGETEEELVTRRQAVRKQLAFYGSTPAYRVVLEHHGWGELQGELNVMSKRGEWEEMACLIDDDVVEAFAFCGDPADVGRRIGQRYGDLLARASIYTPNHRIPDEQMSTLMASIRASTNAPGRRS